MTQKKNSHKKPEENLLTQEKFNEFKDELHILLTVTRKEIAESLEYTRSLGDLSENAEYHAARELQAATEERIRRLEGIIKSATIITEKKKGIVSFGSQITIRKKGDSVDHTYTIVGSEEADMRAKKISHLSPMGESLLGKKKGESFTFETPVGKVEYVVVEVV